MLSQTKINTNAGDWLRYFQLCLLLYFPKKMVLLVGRSTRHDAWCAGIRCFLLQIKFRFLRLYLCKIKRNHIYDNTFNIQDYSMNIMIIWFFYVSESMEKSNTFNFDHFCTERRLLLGRLVWRPGHGSSLGSCFGGSSLGGCFRGWAMAVAWEAGPWL